MMESSVTDGDQAAIPHTTTQLLLDLGLEPGVSREMIDKQFQELWRKYGSDPDLKRAELSGKTARQMAESYRNLRNDCHWEDRKHAINCNLPIGLQSYKDHCSMWLWLQGLEDMHSLLKDRKVSDLEEMKENDLRSVGLSSLQCKRLMLALGKIRTQEQAVSMWLQEMGLLQLQRPFTEHQVDLNSLLLLREDDLLLLGIGDVRVRGPLLQALKKERAAVGSSAQLEFSDGNAIQFAVAANREEKNEQTRILIEEIDRTKSDIILERARCKGLEAALKAATTAVEVATRVQDNSNAQIKKLTRDECIGVDMDGISTAAIVAASEELSNLRQAYCDLTHDKAEKQAQAEATMSTLREELNKVALALRDKKGEYFSLRQHVCEVERQLTSERSNQAMLQHQLDNATGQISVIHQQLQQCRSRLQQPQQMS